MTSSICESLERAFADNEGTCYEQRPITVYFNEETKQYQVELSDWGNIALFDTVEQVLAFSHGWNARKDMHEFLVNNAEETD